MFTVGSNMPGYLPEDPEQIGCFRAIDEAWDYFMDLVREFTDHVAEFASDAALGDLTAEEADAHNQQVLSELEDCVPGVGNATLREGNGWPRVFWVDEVEDDPELLD